MRRWRKLAKPWALFSMSLLRSIESTQQVLVDRSEVAKALLLLKTHAEQSFSSLHGLELLADRS
jgi:hypothetical protein